MKSVYKHIEYITLNVVKHT